VKTSILGLNLRPWHEQFSISFAEIFIHKSIYDGIHETIGEDENTDNPDRNTWFQFKIAKLGEQKVKLVR
jgi:hypothetical protein